jgi:hypothetical protein
MLVLEGVWAGFVTCNLFFSNTLLYYNEAKAENAPIKIEF